MGDVTKQRLREEALRYHREGRPGKIEIALTKPCRDQLDLSLAYTPGVAEPCREIVKQPFAVNEYTNRGNLVGVITNGTAVLGLGDIGALAGKPVMEGKALLFKKFADIDAFDIEVDERDPERFVHIVKSLEPTFGGINLEDIKAPECFAIERRLSEEMDIPVFHDDQHGTAIITTAGFINAIELVRKRVEAVKVVFSGAGAAAVACARMLETVGVLRSNIWMCDREGLVTLDREELEPERGRFAQDSRPMSLERAMFEADVFIGLSIGGLVTPEMVRSMAPRPVIFAMANPDPEISPESAHTAAPDAIVATGRSDYPNQVNNVLGFPFIFRGALDVAARKIDESMKAAAARALARLARESVPQSICDAYGVAHLEFGPHYIIPKPIDPRVLVWEAPAVAEAAMRSGLARKPIADMANYKKDLAARVGLLEY
jgi:malate dehydrogenase (oxaloacetate-decarboxylating)(NADP+)